MTLLSKFGCSRVSPKPLLAANATEAQFASTFYVDETARADLGRWATFKANGLSINW